MARVNAPSAMARAWTRKTRSIRSVSSAGAAVSATNAGEQGEPRVGLAIYGPLSIRWTIPNSGGSWLELSVQ
jgi:hypothetical protein